MNCWKRWADISASRSRTDGSTLHCSRKCAEYERLKDFNENIVESINVGVMALDMEDRIESWNAQMEVMYALPRWQTLTQPVRAVFPPEFVEEFYRVRQNRRASTIFTSSG